jgi:AraC-like DNA-binding protein
MGAAASTAFHSPPAVVVTTSVIKPPCQEFPPSPKFAAHIECFWMHRTEGSVPNFHVFPDGCSDIIFEQPARDYGGLAIVGTMTRAQAFDIPGRHLTFGVRFRPGMAARLLRVPGSVAVDQSIPLADAWKATAVRDLLDQLTVSRSPRDTIGRFEASLAEPAPLDAVEKSLAWLAECGGQVSMDALANAASLSPRQFRRICLERTGLSPKHLARVLRFRQAAKSASGQHPDWADVAIASGYYDQAHLIKEFKELAGVSPAQFSSLTAASRFRSQSSL